MQNQLLFHEVLDSFLHQFTAFLFENGRLKRVAALQKRFVIRHFGEDIFVRDHRLIYDHGDAIDQSGFSASSQSKGNQDKTRSQQTFHSKLWTLTEAAEEGQAW